MGNGPDRRRGPRYGLYRTERKPPPDSAVAHALADLPREFDKAAITRALTGDRDTAIIVRSAQLDLQRLKSHLEAAGILTVDMKVPDRRAKARVRTLGERVRSLLRI